MKHILLEGYNLTLPKGTGIKTYTRNLADVARGLGHRVDVLVQSANRVSTKDPVLAEIGFYDSERKGWKNRWFGEPLSMLHGHPFGLTANMMPRAGVVLPAGAGRLGEQFSEVLAAHQFTLAARRHFRRYKSLLELKPDSRPDIFHTTHAVPVRVRGAANFCTIHDLIPLRLPSATLDNKRYFLRSVRAICREADRIVTISECSKRDLIQIIGVPEDKIDVTWQAVNLPAKLIARGMDETAGILEHVFGLEPGGYFLFFGALEPKKNVSRLIDAYAASGVKAPLVIAGGLGWDYASEVNQIEQEHFSSWRMRDNEITRARRVRRLDHVSFSHLVALIRGSRAVLFPSLYEGFGLPVLEAMTLGAPVMTSNTSSLPEVAGEAAILVDPYDADSMTQAIRALDEDEDLRKNLSARGYIQAEKFSMDRYRARVAKLYSGAAQ